MASELEQWSNLPVDHLAHSTKLPWYTLSFEHKLTPSFRGLLENWSNIAPDDVVSHIHRRREETWKVFPWPCIGEFRFAEQGLLRHPSYSEVLHRLKDNTIAPLKFLDLGTCLGQDLRTLAHAGAPLASLYGADVLPAFAVTGHTLFKGEDRLDEDRFDAPHLISGDVFSNINDLAQTRGSWDMIHISMFFYVFLLEEQEKACEKMLRFRRNTPGSLVFGTQTGRLDAGELVLRALMCEPGEHKTIFRHSMESMKKMCEDAAMSTGMNVGVWAVYDEEHAADRIKPKDEQVLDPHGRFFTGDRERRIFFRVEIV